MKRRNGRTQTPNSRKKGFFPQLSSYRTIKTKPAPTSLKNAASGEETPSGGLGFVAWSKLLVLTPILVCFFFFIKKLKAIFYLNPYFQIRGLRVYLIKLRI